MPRPVDDPFYAQELPGLEGLNAVNASCQHEENVYQYVEESGMGTCDRIVYILQKGSDAQRTTVLDNMKQSLSECTDDEIRTIIAELNECIWQLDMCVQVACAESLISSMPTLNPALVQELNELTETMLHLKESEKIRDHWCDVYVMLLKHVPQAEIEGPMVKRVLVKGDVSQPLYSRLLCCRLIGAFCERAPNARFVSQFLDLTVALCQDTDLAVRAAMCGQLNALARTLGQATTKEIIMRELGELLKDEESEVAKTAFCTLMELFDYLEPSYRNSQAYPIVRGYVVNPPPAIRPVLTANFGKYIYAVKQDMADGGEEDVTAFVRYYVSASQDPNPAVRASCAYNLPAVAASLPPEYTNTHIHAVFRALADDASRETRGSVAAGMHELTKLAGDKSFTCFRHDFIQILHDKDTLVQDKLMANLSAILNSFLPQIATAEDRDKYFALVLPPLVRWWETVATNSLQRLQVLYQHLSSFPSYFSAAQLHGTYLPILLKQLSHGPRCLMAQCAEIVILFCRRLESCSLESDVYVKLVVEFGKSKTYWNRLAFLEICRCTLDLYSRKFFCERLLDSVLELAKDPVSSVRRRLCMLLPALKKALRPPADAEAQANLLQIVSKLQSDTNNDVREAIQAAAVELERVDSEARNGADTDADLLDSEKEAEEQVLKEAMLEQDKLERRQKIREMLHNDKIEKEAASRTKFPHGGSKRSSAERLPPAPNGAVVRQPVGGTPLPRGSGTPGTVHKPHDKKRISQPTNHSRITGSRVTSATKR
eukprot:TRINITY_DN8259_c0_g1_i1.p1 TRINITY_DN8259_c0_g1~~TRINITY_DN8259_c0_g1_i1.p1  ORF type:complete len:822 (+),score=245.73 TRINITY_DN8259_c0_g1_i1:155-2467(+)